MTSVRRALATRPARLAFVVAAVAALTHVEILGYWFTGTDALPLVESSRVQTPTDLAAVLTLPLMQGTAFVENALFYRPVSSLSYAVDYAVWGLNPFGYHLTDLLLHAATAALVALFLRESTDDDAVGTVGGLLFATHPLTVEVVPSVARRQDLLMVGFLVLSMLLFERGLRRREYRYVVASAAASALALASKEVAALLPVFVATRYLLEASRVETDVESWFRRGVRLGAPYAVATAGYFGWRFVVLGGFGGYVGPNRVSEPLARLATRYARSLVYPVDHLDIWFSYGARVVPNGLYVLLPVCLLLLALAVRRRSVPRLVGDERGRTALLLGVWLLLPIALFAWSGLYSVRSGYLAVVPVAGLLAVLLAPSVRRVRRGSGPTPSVPETGGALVAGLLALSLVAGSPLVHPYDHWDHSSDVSRQVVTTIADETEGPPPEETLRVVGLPHSKPVREMADRPQPQSVTYPFGHTVTAWLRLTRSEEPPRVVVGETTALDARPTEVRAETERRPRETVVHLRYVNRSRT